MQEFWQYFTQNIGPWLSQAWENLKSAIQYVVGFIAEHPTDVGLWYTEIIRWVMPILALAILLTVLKSMLKVKNPDETWAYLVNPAWGEFAIHHWECTVGRAKNCDIVINFPTISRMQWALTRDDEGEWMVADLSGKGTSCINGKKLTDYQVISDGDILSVGDVEFGFSLISEEENAMQMDYRLKKCKPLPPWRYLMLLTVFQVLTAVELMFNCPDIASSIVTCYGILVALMWGYVLVCRAVGKIGFEPEVLVFFLCTIGLAITASAAPSSLAKQTFCIVAGFILFMGLGWFLRDLNRVMNARKVMAIITIVLLCSSIILGPVTHGAKNWISIAGISVQPSELAKITFIFAGAASLDLLFNRKNLISFILLSFACFACLGLMSDFGTALIFFVTFLVIAYLRSGDFATLGLICGGAAAGGGLILKFKPYIASRFATWGHAWENASDSGFQQVRTMCAAASGGLIGVGAGCGWLKNVFAAETDLVFGVVCEEWGLIIGLLAIACIVCLAIFAVRICRSCRSAYYTIAACAATSLLVFQTILNVFGSLDILPLTGVTFPFVSCGGSSMIASWGLIAFLKAADTRQNASFAVRKNTKTGDDSHIMVDVDESILQDEEYMDNLTKRNLYRRADKKTSSAETPQKLGLFKKSKKTKAVEGVASASSAEVGKTAFKSGVGGGAAAGGIGGAVSSGKVSEADLESFTVSKSAEGNLRSSGNQSFKDAYMPSFNKSANEPNSNRGINDYSRSAATQYGKPNIGRDNDKYYNNRKAADSIYQKQYTADRGNANHGYTVGYNKQSAAGNKVTPKYDGRSYNSPNYSKQEDYEQLNRSNAKKVHFDPDVARQRNPFANKQYENPYINKGSDRIEIDEKMLADEDYIAELLKYKDKGGK